MVVRDFNGSGTLVCPAEAHTPLIVDTDAMLASSVALQRLKVMGRWQPQIRELCRRHDSLKPHPRSVLKIRRQPHGVPSMKDLFRVFIREQSHESHPLLTYGVINVKKEFKPFIGSMFAPSAGRVSWLMTTALILYLLSAWLGLTVEYTVLTRLENRLKNFLSVFLAMKVLRPLTTNIWEFPFSFLELSSVIFPHGSSTRK